MKKIFSFAIFALILAGCADDEPKYQKITIEQTNAEIANFNAAISGKSTKEIANSMVMEFANKYGSTKFNQKVAQYVYFEEIYANENKVVYNYTLSSGWAGLPNKEKEKFLKYLQTDLVSKSCGTPTNRIAFKKGVSEVHSYFYSYTDNHLFNIDINEEVCVKAGL